MSEGERRSSAKLHKQPEVEDDDGDEAEAEHGQHQYQAGSPQSDQPSAEVEAKESSNGGSTSPAAATTTTAGSSGSTSGEAGVNISGMRTPTVQSASSSSETSPDEAQTHVPVTPAFTRKQTLTRTQALEGTSPPPELLPGHCNPADSRGSSLDVPSHSLTNGGSRSGSETLLGQQPHSSTPSGSPSATSTSQGLLQKKGSQEGKDSLLASQKVSNDSGHGTLDTTDAGSDTSVLSRDSSLENSAAANLYRDSSGVNIPHFIRETMLKSAKDKKTVLSYEKQLIDFCRNDECHVLKMAEATSYDRMIAHRLSAFMGLEHNVDSTGKAVIINKTENMRILKITDFIKLDDQEHETKKKILLKKPASLDEKHSRGGSKGHFGSHRAKSLEERQQIYSEARERIFNKEGEGQGDTLNPPSLLTTQQQHHHHHASTRHHQHLHPARWASTESAPGNSRSGQGAADLRASTMVKSNSYGGVGSNIMPGLMGSDVGPGMILPGYVESPKDLPCVYSAPPNPGGVAPPPLCPSLVGGVVDHTSSRQTPSDEGRPSGTPGPVQPHVNADGSLYRFNPTCPPPFMSQPLVQPSPPAAQLPYQMENLSVSEMGCKYPATGIEAGPGVTGQLVMSHPQTALSYASSHPVPFPQGQYYPSVSPSPVSLPGQPPFQVVAFNPAATPMTPGVQGPQVHPQQQILQPSPLEAQGQTTVPMPAVGVPSLGGGATYVLGPAPYDLGSLGAGPGVAMYASYPPGVEALGVGTPLPQQPHPQLVQYNLAAYGQPQPQLHLPHQVQPSQPQPQVMVPHSGSGHTAYFAAVQASPSSSTPTPPPPPPHHHTPGLTLSQLPPPPPPPQQIPVQMKGSSQAHPHLQHPQHQLQQQHSQPTVFYSPGLSNLTVFSSSMSSIPQPGSIAVMTQPSSSTSSVSKTGPQSAYVQYHSSPPPPPPPAHLHTHNQHSLGPQPHQQHQVIAAAGAPTNGHHHPAANSQHHQQLTLNCSGQPLSFCPTSTTSSGGAVPRGGPVPQQFVAYHPMRPVGTIVHLGGGASVQPLVQPSPVGPAQLQSYHIIRPSGPVNHGSIRPRLTSLQFSNPHHQQSQSKSSNRQSKKGSKRNNNEPKEVDDVLAGGEGAGSGLRSASLQQQHHQQHYPHQQQQPLLVTPVLPGMVGHPHVPSAPNHARQDPPAQL